MIQSNSIGKVIRVEWNVDDSSVRLVLEITDENFKSRVLHSNTYEDLLVISGIDVMNTKKMEK